MKKKYKILLPFFSSLIVVFFIIYKLVFYTPPLIDSGGRNFVEKTIDFLYFGWHFTKASIYKDYLNKKNKANAELGKAGWYRKKFLIKYFGVNGKDINSVLVLYKRMEINSISEKLDAFLLKKQGK